MDAKTIAALVENEHPQIAALVLAHLDAAIAADVLQLLPADMQSDVIYRVATLGEVTSEALDELERILAEQATRPSASPAPFHGRTSERSEEDRAGKGGGLTWRSPWARHH